MARRIAVFASLALLLASPAAAQVEAAPGWLVDSAERAGDVKVESFLGETEALWLRAGTHAVLADSRMADGTIDFDVAPMDGADFVAVTFRRQSFSQHENVYLRIRRSGDFMALQYAPRMGSSTWQLYPEFTAAVDWPENAWTHVRLQVRGSRLEVFVGDMDTPALVVPRLRHAGGVGEVGVWARINDRPQDWAAAIANLRVRPSSAPARLDPPQPPAPGFIARWSVAGPFPAGGVMPDSAQWRELTAEESGLVNLSRALERQAGAPQTAIARATIVSGGPRTVRLGVGYSDRIEVRLNGQPVYGASNGFDSRHPGYTGFVDTRFEHVFLDLRAGENQLEFAVTDDQAFGWGFAARLDSLEGLTLAP